ncbi:MAG: N-acetyl-ornithine/N-acetyl-lysine deacetylase [Chloroflexi bacterium]|nr:N-acetyl-ornithine/N-acetyl-lysine deacetylase [Chloroflexota bacterium]
MDDVELLETMLRIESLSGREGEVARFLCDEMAVRGFRSWVDGVGNVIGERGDPTTGPTVLLLGHMDTVPGNIPVRVENGRLYGRGAVDAKGPLAAFISAASRVKLAGRIVVVGAVEEESASSAGAKHIAKAYNPDAAIIGEPSAWDRITVGYKGRLLVRYTVTRDSSHTASDRQGACEAAVEYWQSVLGAVAEANRDRPPNTFERLSPSIRSMSSHTDGMRERATLQLGFRLPPGFDGDAWQEVLRGLTVDAELEFAAYEPSVRVAKNTTVARAFIQAIRHQGGDPRFVVKTGTSDMNVVNQTWQCPMLAYGPGDSTLDHTPDEHISLSEYQSAIDVLVGVLNELAITVGATSHRAVPTAS